MIFIRNSSISAPSSLHRRHLALDEHGSGQIRIDQGVTDGTRMWVGEITQPLAVQRIAAEVWLEKHRDLDDVVKTRVRSSENFRGKIEHVRALRRDRGRRCRRS